MEDWTGVKMSEMGKVGRWWPCVLEVGSAGPHDGRWGLQA